MWLPQMQTNAAAAISTHNLNVAISDESFQDGEKLLVKYWTKTTTFPHLRVSLLDKYGKSATKRM